MVLVLVLMAIPSEDLMMMTWCLLRVTLAALETNHHVAVA
jgi:hypothetical protein